MVFLLKETTYEQHSEPIETYEEAEEYCKIFFTEHAHYIITKIIKEV